MLHDLVGPEVTIFGAHKVIECKSFRNEYLASLPADEPDPKQKMIDHVMDLLDKQHAEIEAKK